MSDSNRAVFWIRGMEALALAIAVCISLGATNTSARINNLSHRLMCTCGCAQLLGECNHVGCTQSTQELGELRADVAAGMSDQQIFNAFVTKYGATVLAAPPTKGFDLLAWIAPFAVFGAALLGVILLVRRWSAGKTLGAVVAADDAASLALREKIRRETDTESNGGFRP